jgi:hypothetical protein
MEINVWLRLLCWFINDLLTSVQNLSMFVEETHFLSVLLMYSSPKIAENIMIWCEELWFLDIPPYGPVKLNWRFRGIYRLHLYVQQVSQARDWFWSRQQTDLLLLVGFFLGLVFKSEYGSPLFLRNIAWLSLDYAAMSPRKQKYS